MVYNREMVQRIKAQYPAGTRIRLQFMSGEADMPSGITGTVDFVDDIGQLQMTWDNSRALALVPGEDAFTIIPQSKQEPRMEETSEIPEKQHLTENEGQNAQEQYRQNIRFPVGLSWMASPQEDLFIENRIAEMSPKERLMLEAAMQMTPVETAADFINLSFQLYCYEICYPAKDDRELGEYVARYLEYGKDSALSYIDKEKLGRQYRTRQSPGVFTGSAYVFPTGQTAQPVYDGTNLSELKDDGYSVKLKLFSASNKDGVWLRLPDYAEVESGRPDELRIALDTLGVSSLQECRALEAVCVLPNIRNLLEQYDSLDKLVWDGSNLGYVLDEQWQGKTHAMKQFQAAMEYEGCDRLDFALDISQNLNCYDFLPDAAAAMEHGKKTAIENGLVCPGTLTAESFDYESYGHQQIQNAGMVLTDYGYIKRNEESFYYDYSQAPIKPEMSM